MIVYFFIKNMKRALFTLILSFVAISLYATIHLPNILSSNMVLQQKSTTKLWGWGSPDEKISINTSWDNKTIKISADGNARWQVDIQTPEAGGPYTIVFQGENKIVLENIFIGEVWVCSGQSNMEWSYNDTLNIHPTNKKDVGSRIANLALVETYGIKKQAYKSPLFKSFTVNGSTAVIEFDNAEVGLILKGEKPKEIFIAGADKVFYPAMVKIKGDKIYVSSKQVKVPAAVRYQFSNAAIGNLFSKADLPVAPFRTDNWEVNTSAVK